MVSEEPKISLNGRYPIGEAAALLGIDRSTLRRHTDMGLVKCGFNRTNARRFYKGSELKRYWLSSY